MLTPTMYANAPPPQGLPFLSSSFLDGLSLDDVLFADLAEMSDMDDGNGYGGWDYVKLTTELGAHSWWLIGTSFHVVCAREVDVTRRHASCAVK